MSTNHSRSHWWRVIALLACTTCEYAQANETIVSREIGEREGLAALEGVWSVASITDSGNLLPQEKTQGVTFVFNKDKLTWLAPDGRKIEEFCVAVNDKQEPNAIDLVNVADGKGKTTLAIYELKNNSLRMYIPSRGSLDRPNSFKCQQGSQLSLICLKRIKE